MHPSQVLDCQADLVSRLSMADYKHYVQSCWLGDPGTNNLSQRHKAMLMHNMVHRLQMAHAFHVTADMCDLVRHAADSLPDDEEIDHRLAPTESGIVRFDSPMEVTARDNITSRIHWVVWGKIWRTASHPDGIRLVPDDGPKPEDSRSGSMMWCWNDIHDDPDEMQDGIVKEIVARRIKAGEDPQDILSFIGRWGWAGALFMSDGEIIGGKWITDIPEYTHEYQRRDEWDGEPYINFRRIMHALWLLLDQTITVQEDALIDRHARKRARKMGIPDRVTVIDLRRRENRPSEGDTQVEWSHRWIVRGHWHRYRYKEDGVWKVKRLWIHPYPKGPADKPLVITDKVYNFRR